MNFGQPTSHMIKILIITNPSSESGKPTVIIDGRKLTSKKWVKERKQIIDHVEAMADEDGSDRSSPCNAEEWSAIVIEALRRFKRKTKFKSIICNPYCNRWDIHHAI